MLSDKSGLKVDRPKYPVPGGLTTIGEYRRRSLLYLVVEYLNLMGATGIRARLAHFPETPLYEGLHEDHRPDLLCQQWNKDETYLMVDVVTKTEFEKENSRRRWELLCSAAQRYNVEMVFVTPWDIGPKLGIKLRAMGLAYNDIWAIGGAA